MFVPRDGGLSVRRVQGRQGGREVVRGILRQGLRRHLLRGGSCGGWRWVQGREGGRRRPFTKSKGEETEGGEGSEPPRKSKAEAEEEEAG